MHPPNFKILPIYYKDTIKKLLFLCYAWKKNGNVKRKKGIRKALKFKIYRMILLK